MSSYVECVCSRVASIIKHSLPTPAPRRRNRRRGATVAPQPPGHEATPRFRRHFCLPLHSYEQWTLPNGKQNLMKAGDTFSVLLGLRAVPLCTIELSSIWSCVWICYVFLLNSLIVSFLYWLKSLMNYRGSKIWCELRKNLTLFCGRRHHSGLCVWGNFVTAAP